jgi:REP element-mobilizing transposase RayT
MSVKNLDFRLFVNLKAEEWKKESISYYVESVGHISESVIKKYIEEQKNV